MDNHDHACCYTSFEELHFYLQPKFNLDTGLIDGAEALVRHRSNSAFSPLGFIQMLERARSIDTFDRWSLQENLRFLRQSILADQNTFGHRIAVNISAITLAQSSIPDYVACMLEEFGIPASSLELEVTETQPVTMLARQNLKILADLGVRMWMDDYGSAYSNLLAVSMTGWSGIKVDREVTLLLDNPETFGRGVAILQKTAEMAHDMGVSLVVEGVDKREQLLVLKRIGVTHVQGYLFGRPRPQNRYLVEDENLLDKRELVQAKMRRQCEVNKGER